MKKNRIHIAFGFHVNCYHSYRGDTNDALGFGSDIRIIRKIISALDRCNAEGIPVKGTWDCENFFSLEQILPRYAPDIIEGIRRRVQTSGDENIIMGYSNGALGAMTKEELAASIELSVSNPQGSGLQDLFGSYEKIVRPQEVMFSPSQVGTYNALGVRALCLYYSCVPFDAFKTLIPPMTDEWALNPLTYTYQGDSITVIPTYSNADVCDAGCLRAWVKDLREKQLSGEIDRDLFLFINMDADAIFWESLALPVIGSRIANTDGINGLVREIADLDYIVFNTPGGYLNSHAPVGTVCFSQDTADGNYTGYASWAEKPYNRKIWTAIERSRAAEKAKPDDKAFLQRIQLLSTTHFGLATPVLNIQREQKADDLARDLTASHYNAEGTLTVQNISGTAFQCLQLACDPMPKDISQLIISAEDLVSYTAIPCADRSVYLMLLFSEVKEQYRLNAAIKPDIPIPERIPFYKLTSGDTALSFSVLNRPLTMMLNGKVLCEDIFFASYLTYNGKQYSFSFEELSSGEIAGGKCIALRGGIRLPGAVRQGSFCFRFFTSDVLDGIFLLSDVKYPYTPEADAISTENSTLGRFTDMRWEEAVPFSLTPALSGDIRVLKRNYEGALSDFRVRSFAEADPANAALAAFNNQLTAGAVGITDGTNGIMLYHARQFLSSMAVCPMRLHGDGSVSMNPFGTYAGPQRHHPNRSGERIPKTYTMIAPQGKSLAPSYNGSRETALHCIAPFSGKFPEEQSLQRHLAFADGAYVTGTAGPLSPFREDNIQLHPPGEIQTKIKMHSPVLTGFGGHPLRFIYRGVRAITYILLRQKQANKL